MLAFLLTAWTYLKKYWGIFAAIAGFLVFEILLNRQSTDLGKQMQDLEKRHQDELEQIKKAHDVEEQQHVANVAKMQEQLRAIEAQYETSQKQLDESKRQEIQQILSDTKSNPDELAKRLSQVTGFAVILPDGDSK